ncbi:MAG: right-handed parallel beta-helix repeat-containing protein [Planctomycetota bacterium]
MKPRFTVPTSLIGTLTAALAMVPSVMVRADTIHVREGAAGAGTGASWVDAFPRLDIALSAASVGDEIWVAAGTYTPPTSPMGFVLRSGVGVYGGFAGSETLRSQRNAAANLTILGANGSRVLVADGVDAATAIDGFSIVGSAVVQTSGGGLSCVGGSPTITNCTFADNTVSFAHGGAIYLLDSSASITHCTFTGNLAYQGSGGAIFVDGNSVPTIRDCTFTGNETVSTYGQTGLGGAIQLYTSTPVTIERCVFDGNIARPFGGGSYEIPRGGAIHSFCINNDPRPTTTIRECVFRNNQAAYGGGVFVWNPSTILNCTFDHNTAFNYAGQGGVTVGGEGAGICAQWTTVTVLNSTIANNTGGESGGISVFEYLPNFPALASVRNSIIWGNIATGQDINVRDPSFNGPFSARNSCVQHLFSADPGEDPIDPANYPGCIITNPQFVSAVGGNLRLQAGSACIDRGANAFVPAGTPTDLDANARIVRGLAGPGASTVDMGAFEFGAQPCVPAIGVHPHDAAICPSGTGTFSVTVSGTGTLAYRWQVQSPSDPGTWIPLTDGDVMLDGELFANISGSQSAVLVVRHSIGHHQNAQFNCVVTNACGSVTSDGATLTICAADFDCDGTADFFDYDAFVNCFEGLFCPPAKTADFDGDGTVDFFDYDAFVVVFETGC